MRRVFALPQAPPAKSGGKATNLAWLTQAGLPVPAGFVVTFDAFDEFREQGGLSDGLRREVCEAYEQLVAGRRNATVAVRSSASAEDLATASFAGQQESYLFVSGREAVLGRIVDCFGSLYSPRAVAYRREMGVSAENLRMAVIVQTMVSAKAAGVLFTQDPHGGRRDTMIVEANWGWGTSVVSGRVTPDHFEIRRADELAVVGRRLGEKDITVEQGHDGPIEAATPAELQSGFCMTESGLLELCGIGLEIESLLGQPQDIEWALDQEDGVHILQARPITATAPARGPLSGRRAPLDRGRGLGASSGRHCGRARIVLSPADLDKVGPGDVLVAMYTNPSMVPAMIRAGAIATERGGMVCHAAIVSRELGIPCVVGVSGLTEGCRDGDPLLVDGDSGVVTRLRAEAGIDPAAEGPVAQPGPPAGEVAALRPVPERQLDMPIGEYEFDFDSALDQAVDALARMFSQFTYSDMYWPNPSNTGYSSFIGYYIGDLHRLMVALEQKRVSVAELADLFITPTCVFRTFARIARARDHLARDERLNVARMLLAAMDALRAYDRFGGDTNQRLSDVEVSRIVKATAFRGLTPAGLGRRVLRLNCLLWNLAETLYWTRWSTGFDYEGPYRVSDRPDELMIVRDAFELCPTELWPQAGEFPYRAIRTQTVYRGIADFRIDPYGHLTHSGHLGRAAVAFHCLVTLRDGRTTDSVDILDEVIEALQEATRRNAEIVGALEVSDRVMKQAEIEWYILRRLFAYLGEGWQPGDEVRESILAGEYVENLMIAADETKTRRERYEEYRRALNPGN